MCVHHVIIIKNTGEADPDQKRELVSAGPGLHLFRALVAVYHWHRSKGHIQ